MAILAYNNGQKISLVFLRILIGWHFLYEGIIKLYHPGWTAKGYLYSAEGPFQLLFQWLAQDNFIGWIDSLNIAALVAVGIFLTIGFFTKPAAMIGMALLALYYLAHPPFPGLAQGAAEGTYWIVNKILIEMAALYVLYSFPTEHHFGIARFFKNSKPHLNPTKNEH